MPSRSSARDARIAAAGIDFCLEPLAPSETNFLNTCAQATELIGQVGHPQFQAAHGRESPERRDGRHGAGADPPLCGEGRTFPRPGRQPPRPRHGRCRLRADPEGAVESGYDRWVSVEVFDFSPGAEETASQSIACLCASCVRRNSEPGATTSIRVTFHLSPGGTALCQTHLRARRPRARSGIGGRIWTVFRALGRSSRKHASAWRPDTWRDKSACNGCTR